MPHAVRPQDVEAEKDDKLIADLLGGDPTQNNLDFLNRDLDVGEKANDAEDFEDIGDDDLAEDEDAFEDGSPINATTEDILNGDDESGEHAEGDDDLADLFGPSSPAEEEPDLFNNTNALQPASGNILPTDPTRTENLALPGAQGKASAIQQSQTGDSEESPAQQPFRQTDHILAPEEEDDETREQKELFRKAAIEREQKLRRVANATDVPPPPQTNAELFETIWPQFESGKAPRFMELLPGKRAFFLGRAPLKPPKPVQPTKVNLELSQDQERTFRLPITATNKGSRQTEAQKRGLVLIEEAKPEEQSSDDDLDLEDMLDDEEPVGNTTWNDLHILCEDWDLPSPISEPAEDDGLEDLIMQSFGDDGDWEFAPQEPPTKKRKTNNLKIPDELPVYTDTFPSLDDPELLTSTLGSKITLDLNDPQLLIDVTKPDLTKKVVRKTGTNFSRDVSGSLNKALSARYNISNDAAYDALKENHQNKVRSMLGKINVEHSSPAIKLQYPFYKVKLEPREARSFHRPLFHCKPNERAFFSKNKVVKRKHLKGQDVANIFAKAHDLSLGDNSHALLVEYSEEYPMMMSNFGMSNRLLNYYRRRDADDTTRPKLDLGEPAPLMPHDKSPFSIFGEVEAGKTVPTLHNPMFIAPVFKHESKRTDFLVCRSVTGTHGANWHLRDIENLMVVGQQFPQQEVPGTHSRKVTEAAKRRLKMISYRIWERNSRLKVRGPILSNEMIRSHLPGTDIAQNRGKMREFMAYDKETGSWMPKSGDVVPTEEVMRNWIKPEDICMLDSMQVGHRHLMDAGYSKEDGDADEDDEEKDGQSLEEQLAPWHTTKNFLNACAGKAMLQLHGEGDPSGRGEAFSFIKTSMKGGFKAIGESIEDKLDAKRLKELGGHSYNVARQQRAYEEAIKRIWEAQERSLTSNIEHSDVEMDVDTQEETSTPYGRGRTPRSEFGTPAPSFRHGADDESASQFSRLSATSQKGKVMKIVRRTVDELGNVDEQQEVISDPRVIRAYLKRRRAKELSEMKLAELRPTGNDELDAQKRKRLEEELARLERNRERRHTREKQKGLISGAGSTPATPGSPSAGPVRGAGTQRRCANCGQVGHIKTNKKLCPMLNGTMKRDDGFDDAAFASPATVTPTTATSMHMPPPSAFFPPPASSPS